MSRFYLVKVVHSMENQVSTGELQRVQESIQFQVLVCEISHSALRQQNNASSYTLLQFDQPLCTLLMSCLHKTIEGFPSIEAIHHGIISLSQSSQQVSID